MPTGSELMQNPAIAAAMKFHQQRTGGGQPQQAGQPPAQQPQPQAQAQGKIPTPPDIQERMIILNAMAGHLKALDSVLKPDQGAAGAPPMPMQPPAQPPLQPPAQGGA